MLKVVTFMKQVAMGLQMEGNFGTAHVYRSSLNAIIAYCGEEDLLFSEVTSEWLKGFEVYLRSRGCSWNTVSTYLRTFRAVYNRAVDLGKAPYVPHLFRSVYTGTRADHKRALCDDDMKKVFAKLSRTSGVPFAVSGGLSLFMSTILKQMDDFVLLAPIMKFMIRLIPFVLTWLMFTGLYIFMPNTKVKFKHALIAGILAGSAYQAFQFLYINSQLWVSKYNAIYGSFAALPLFLLWLQISWTICLFGAELTYAGQNIRSFSFDQDTRNISRRYRDFISILIMSLIAKRFEKNEPPYTAAEISEEHQIPIRLTNQVLYQLQEIELIHEVVTDEKSEEIGYQPSMDINQLNVAILLDRLDTYGSENFKIDKDEEFNDEWKVLTESREEYYKKASKVLLKDL